MKTYDTFRLSLSHVKKSKMRSWLTIIGIVIGVAAVVAIISIGQGMQESVASRLGSLGADLITVTPGFSRATGGGGFDGGRGGGSTSINLTDKDVNVIKQVRCAICERHGFRQVGYVTGYGEDVGIHNRC
ncbi:MAG: ABC transporter permease [Candidatus Methanoperedens nitroreducens]|uniref:ABC transporter permease n=1 Tax=Candidatus Methanoperedens nitratireducens TaxID=1392998 RepID=A0A0P8CM98_9EURY|nr:MAG: ABC transporter permease [Candidatus Methanoperedens sp. BLZ1]